MTNVMIDQTFRNCLTSFLIYTNLKLFKIVIDDDSYKINKYARRIIGSDIRFSKRP